MYILLDPATNLARSRADQLPSGVPTHWLVRAVRTPRHGKRTSMRARLTTPATRGGSCMCTPGAPMLGAT